MNLMPLTWVPLAWLNLTHNKRRFFVAIAGISFAVVLMFVQLGFWNALIDGSVALIDLLDADLVIVNRAKDMLSANEPFSRRRLEQAEAVVGVRSSTALYLDPRLFSWKNPDLAGTDAPGMFPIRVIAFDPARPALRSPEVLASLDKLLIADNVLLDVKSKSRYGRRSADLERELSRNSIRVVGVFALGTDFVNDGNLIMSDSTYARYLARHGRQTPLARVEVGLIRLEPGTSEHEVLASLRRTLPDDVDVMTLREFRVKEQRFWQEHTPIGFIFGMGMVMGILVGVVICYQILAAEVADRLSEFATLKAIGYGDSFLMSVVLQEALYLALLGYIPGLILSAIIYRLLEDATGLPLRLTAWCAFEVIGFAVVMCVLSGLLVLRKVQVADPAEVF